MEQGGEAAAPKLLIQVAIVVDVGVEYGVNKRLHSRERLVDAKAVHTVRNERLEGESVSGRQRQQRAPALSPAGCAPCPPLLRPRPNDASPPDAASAAAAAAQSCDSI